MREIDVMAPTFGETAALDAQLSSMVRGLKGSEILKIAAEVRAMIAAGKPVLNLTVGDFDTRQFPVPEFLAASIRAALDAGETNYPPSDGILALRQAVREFTARDQGVRYPLESVVIAGGARPIIYASYRAVVEPGEAVLYPVPSWNNNHYTWIVDGRAIEVATAAENGFQPTLEQLAPLLPEARLLVLNSPLNPAGTVIGEAPLAAILRAVVDENARRATAGKRSLFVLWDQIYSALVFGAARHLHPLVLVPEIAPHLIVLDGISKSLAATGLRVGWLMAAPAVAARMRDLLGHIGAWAPRPEQVATAAFLNDAAAIEAFRTAMDERVRVRLDALYSGFERLRAAGMPVRCIEPQGAIYLSLQIDLIGRAHEGTILATNEQIRQLLLDRAGLAIVPFQAFGLRDETGWFRLSVGAISSADIGAAFERLEALLSKFTPR